MKFLNLTISSLTAALLLTACQGQNPFKRESNPVRNYPKVNESIRTKTGLVPFNRNQEPPKPAPDNSQAICSAPFAITIQGQAKPTDLLQFPEDKLTSYEVEVTNRFGDEIQIQDVQGFPEKETFRLLRKLSDNKSVFQISWNPKRLNPGEFTREHYGSVLLTSASIAKICRGSVGMNFLLQAKKSSAQPGLAVSGLPQAPVVYGSQASFNIEVEDGSGRQPTLNPFTYKEGQVRSGERNIIDGTKAILCQELAEQVSGTRKWKFTCLFDSNLLADNPKAIELFNSNKIGTVVVFASATSQDNTVTSSVRQINIKVKFEKVITAGPAANPGDKK